MELGGSITLLFIIAALVALAARRLHVPYTVALVVAGLALSAADIATPLVLDKDLLFALFLPGLLFEAAFHLEAEEFWRNRLTIFSLALPGVVVATIITALVLVPALQWSGVEPALGWGAALVFATLIGATDPIAVVALVRNLGAPRRLSVLIEGESLLNDGTAAVFFSVAVSFVLGSQLSTASLLMDVVYAIGAGVIVGGTIGLTLSQIIGRLDDRMLQITLTTIAAYGSFAAAERLGASGVIATVTAGLLCGNRDSQRALAPSSRVAVTTFWEYVAFALNSLVFLLIGIQVSVTALLTAWRPILVAYVVVTLGRTLVTFGIAAVLPKSERIPPRWTAVLTWSGVRGALAMVLALSLPDAMPQRDFVVLITFGVVMLSILVQGLTVSSLMQWLGIARPNGLRAIYAQARGELMASRAAIEELEHMVSVHVMHPVAHASLSREYAERVASAEARMRALHVETGEMPDEELDRARRHLLLVERDQIVDAFRLGAMTEVVRDRLLADIDARWVRSELGSNDDLNGDHEESDRSERPTR